MKTLKNSGDIKEEKRTYLAEFLELSLLFLLLLLLLVGDGKFEPLLGDADELLAFVLLLLDSILIDGVHHVEDLCQEVLSGQQNLESGTKFKFLT